MTNFNLDLKGCDIFDEDILNLDEKITFIFGKNGTGKSTLASLLKNQIEDYDFRCFQGFDEIVGEEKKLNAVILGEENVEIDKEIKKLEEEIGIINVKILDIEKDILEPETNRKNLFTKVKAKEEKYEEQNEVINKFYRKSAKKIKDLSEPQVAKTSYNINDFKSEISKAKILDDKVIEKYKKQINVEIKIAYTIEYIPIDFEGLLNKTNSLLLKKVNEKEIIAEFYGNSKKTVFAEEGLKLHNYNEKCAFCGNVITQERYDKLNKFFSGEDIQSFKNEINSHINNLDILIDKVGENEINSNDFYPEYEDEINKININFNTKKTKILSFLKKLKKSSDEKLKELFEELSELDLIIPDSYEDELEEFNEVVVKNNKLNLNKKIEESKDQIRFHKIEQLLSAFKYNEGISKLSRLKSDYDAENNILNEKNNELNDLKNKIEELNNEISNLKLTTKNEKILANNINKKLKLYVNFDLEHVSNNEEKGYYFVKSRYDGSFRDITQLSTGEKNIIAFLYFIEKLNEVDHERNNLNKFIVFDDPMNSNDDTMQYLIIEELNKLMRKLSEDDKIIIMTHNSHFYINIKYNYNSYNKNIVLRLLPNGKNTKIKRITNKDEDFKTNYKALWGELEFLYKHSPYASMLLNPIRRIIETYTKFNLIEKNDMFNHVPGATKLFNVNSHSIDDLEAELNGKTRNDIMKIMRECFEKENGINHFNEYWTIDLGDA